MLRHKNSAIEEGRMTTDSKGVGDLTCSVLQNTRAIPCPVYGMLAGQDLI